MARKEPDASKAAPLFAPAWVSDTYNCPSCGPVVYERMSDDEAARGAPCPLCGQDEAAQSAGNDTAREEDRP